MNPKYLFLLILVTGGCIDKPFMILPMKLCVDCHISLLFV